MADSEGNSALFPIFVLTTIALPLIPYTLLRLFRAVSNKGANIHCECSVCNLSGKYQKSNLKKVTSCFTCHNLTVVLLWIFMVFLSSYIKHMKTEIQVFEPFSILGLEPGASESDIKKAYRNLSRQYHPDKNPDPEAHKYFVESISKAYQALTDPIARENFEKYGHPDGRQGFEIGIALPQFLLDLKGESGGILLICIVGVLIFLPLVMAVVYLSRSSRYAGSFVRRETISTYFKMMKASLTQRKVLEIFLEADEYKSIPTRKTDEAPIQKLFAAVKDELSLNQKNVKQEELKFFDRHPALVKTEILIHAYLTRQTEGLSLDLQQDLKHILQWAPRLLEELLKMALVSRTDEGHGWLRPSIEAIELCQRIMQAVRLSAKKVAEGSAEGLAPFLQLPHFTETVVEKMGRKRSWRLREFQNMTTQERAELLSEIGLSSYKAHDVEKVLEILPRTAVEVSCQTEGEEGIQEGDVVTMQAWVTLKRGNGSLRALPHTPYYPFDKEENFWFMLADANDNKVWLYKKVNFRDEAAAVTAASRAVEHKVESSGATVEETSAAVKDAINRVRSGSRLVLGQFLAPAAGTYNLTCHLMCDSWIDCDTTTRLVVKVLKPDKTPQRSNVTDEIPVSEEDESEEEEEDDDEYASEYSEDDEEDEVIEQTSKKKTEKVMTSGKGKQEKNSKASNKSSRKRR